MLTSSTRRLRSWRGRGPAIDALLDKLTELATQLRKAAKYTYTIPSVSELYEKIASAPLTALDLAALMAAIPATIFYKVVYGAAPFPSDLSVDEFKRNFTGQWLLDASGLGTNLTERSVGELSADMQRQAQYACIGFTAIYGGFSALLDGLNGAENLAAPMPDPFTERGWYKWLSLITFLVGLGNNGASCPWIYKQNPFVAPCLSWFIETVFSNGLNLFFLIKDGVRMENDNTIFLGKDMNYVGTFSNTCISVIDMIAISLLWVEKPFELQDLGLYLPMFPGLTKFAMLKGALKPNPWLVALCPAIDGIFYGLSCMYLGFTLPPLPPHEESALAPAS